MAWRWARLTTTFAGTGHRRRLGRRMPRRHRDAVPDDDEHPERRGAIGVFNLDTTKLANGLHTIAWSVTDDQGRVDGIGSRFFTVSDGGSGLTASGRRGGRRPPPRRPCGLHAECARGAGAAWVRRLDSAWRRPATPTAKVAPASTSTRRWKRFDADAAGVRLVRVPELGRVELHLGHDTTAGYLSANGTLRPLPAGSQLDAATGVFTWAPGPGYRAPMTSCFSRARRRCR